MDVLYVCIYPSGFTVQMLNDFFILVLLFVLLSSLSYLLFVLLHCRLALNLLNLSLCQELTVLALTNGRYSSKGFALWGFDVGKYRNVRWEATFHFYTFFSILHVFLKDNLSW